MGKLALLFNQAKLSRLSIIRILIISSLVVGINYFSSSSHPCNTNPLALLFSLLNVLLLLACFILTSFVLAKVILKKQANIKTMKSLLWIACFYIFVQIGGYLVSRVDTTTYGIANAQLDYIEQKIEQYYYNHQAFPESLGQAEVEDYYLLNIPLFKIDYHINGNNLSSTDTFVIIYLLDRSRWIYTPEEVEKQKALDEFTIDPGCGW